MAPACAGTEAALPVLFAQVAAGAVTVETGLGVIATFALLVEEQPLFVTVAVRATVPDAPAVNWIAFVPAPEVIVPFVMLQL